jgi:hypothetical protein
MARPKKSLLQRCIERSFRARHHWPLLVSEPELSCPSLAKIQGQAREAQDEEAVKALAHVFARALHDLSPEERQLLQVACSPAAPEDAAVPGPTTPLTARPRQEALLTALEAALTELSAHGQLNARELAEIELTRREAERLAEISQRLAEEGLTVLGSQRQLRPHPLLAHEARLCRELSRKLWPLEFRIVNRAAFERLKESWQTGAAKPTNDDGEPSITRLLEEVLARDSGC